MLLKDAVRARLTPDTTVQTSDVGEGEMTENHTGLHRRIGPRQVQLFAIGGSIGTALFVSIGAALYKGGPASLFLALVFQSCIMGLVNNCMAEMIVLMPVSGGFVRLADHWVDRAFGFMAGVNFFLYEALQIPFEITALNVVLGYWRDDIPIAAVCIACTAAYAMINFFPVKFYGEVEFWLSSGKVILLFILFLFTFVTMVGGNPQHDSYGFRNWTDPAPFNEWISTGSMGKFEGFLECLWFSAFIVVGPEYISMIAAEAVHPRVNIKRAFKTTYWRFGLFFIGSALCVGTVISSRDSTLGNLVGGSTSGSGTATASPYVIAMSNLRISALPHLVNALLFTSIFSAGNTYMFCATRNLYGLAQVGHAPKFLLRCTKSGIPIYCLGIVTLFPFLSLLQLSNSTAQVLEWLVGIITGGGLINFIVVCITYLCYYQANVAQGVDRRLLPYYGWFQPFSAWIGLIVLVFIAIFNGYAIFLPGEFTASGFLTKYAMIILAPICYAGSKICWRTRLLHSVDVDLVWERPLIDAYEERQGEETSGSLKIQLKDILMGRLWEKSTSGDGM